MRKEKERNEKEKKRKTMVPSLQRDESGRGEKRYVRQTSKSAAILNINSYCKNKTSPSFFSHRDRVCARARACVC